MSATPFQTEAWTEYGIGCLVLFLRYFARWKAVGFKGWQGDDFFAVLALGFWTAELCMLELIGQNGTNIGVTVEMAAGLSDEQAAKLELGSKYLLIGWNMYVTLIWCLKGCILCFYERMTFGLKQYKLVKWTQAISVVAYATVVTVIWAHCTPIHRKWQVRPPPGDECTLDVANYISLVVMNISTDILIVSIPLPLLWKVKLELGRKLVIGVLLCSGVFIMIATLLRCVLSLRNINGINTSTIWAIRETFVGIIAVNAGCIKPLFSSSRWIKSSNDSNSKGKSGGPGSSYAMETIGGSGAGTSRNRRNVTLTDLGENSSEEHIVQKGDHNGNGFHSDVQAGSTGSRQSRSVDGIIVTKTYEITPQKMDV